MKAACRDQEANQAEVGKGRCPAVEARRAFAVSLRKKEPNLERDLRICLRKKGKSLEPKCAKDLKICLRKKEKSFGRECVKEAAAPAAASAADSDQMIKAS